MGDNAEASLKSIVGEAQAKFDGIAQDTVSMQKQIEGKFSELENKGSALEQKVKEAAEDLRRRREEDAATDRDVCRSATCGAIGRKFARTVSTLRLHSSILKTM